MKIDPCPPSRTHVARLRAQLIRCTFALLVVQVSLQLILMQFQVQENDEDPHPSNNPGQGSTSFVSQQSKKRQSITLQYQICFGCLHALVHNTSRTCGEYLYSGSYSPRDLARNFAECRRCLPDSCTPDEKIFHRYDHVAPKILHATVVELRSLPNKYRLPPEAAVNGIQSYLQDANHRHPHRQYLFSYNPSIIQLPSAFVSDDALYLASFRVSNLNFCLRREDRIQMMGNEQVKPINHLGLALMSENFTVLEDAVFDASAALERAEDYRLFAFGHQIFLSTSDHITELFLHQGVISTNQSRRKSDEQVLRVVFPGSSPLHVLRRVSVRQPNACAPCGRKGPCGKNMNYFLDENSNVYTEIWPTSPRKVRPVDLGQPCHRKVQADNIDSSLHAPSRTFGTMEEIIYPALSARQRIFTRGRGGGCCVELRLSNNGTSVMVGVAHVKTPSQGKKRASVPNLTENHYLSFFYAFSKKRPFKLMAQSGYFCLGFPREAEEPTLTTLTRWRKLDIGGEIFDCPRIHFVSGMTVDIKDPENIILAYGINDCTSRFVTVSAQSVEKMLFPL